MLANKNKYDHHDFVYTVLGKKYKRKELVDYFYKLTKDGPKTIPQMQKETNMDMMQLRNFVRWMVDTNLFMNTGKKKGDYFLFGQYRDCLLAETLYPSPQEIEKQFNIKGRIRKKAEDFKNLRSNTKRNNFTYSNHHLNSVYYADGE